MIRVPRKTRYALRALFELAKHYRQGPVRISDIAAAQAIPPRFLETILNQLRQAGLVQSVRGSQGGYLLAREPSGLSVGELMRVLEGEVELTECVSDEPAEDCPLYGECVFRDMWERASTALAEVYDSTTLQDFLNQERERCDRLVDSYNI